MSEYTTIRVLIELLERCQMFDDGVRKDSLWISGDLDGVAFTVEFNYPGVSKIVQEEIKKLLISQ